MCILSDGEILNLMKSGRIVIEGFSSESLTPNGYDLRVSEILLPSSGQIWREGVAVIPSNTLFYLSTIEAVRLPSDISAQLWLRTSWIRKGIMASFGKVDAGFYGTLTFSGFNASSSAVEIPIGSKFAQIVFEQMNKQAEMKYEERSGHYQGQKGITLTPLKEEKIE
jgi:dCTP deaminase